MSLREVGGNMLLSFDSSQSLSAINSVDDKDKSKVIIEMDSKKILEANHPLMTKYQKDLKDRLLKLLEETEEQIVDLNRTVTAQEKENSHFAERGYDLQKELKLQEDKLNLVHKQHEEQLKKKENSYSKCNVAKANFQTINENLKTETKKDGDLQRTIEDLSFEVVQLTSLKISTSSEAKTLQHAVKKIAKDKEQLEIQKLRQDFLISRLENDRFGLEDKINFYNTQWGIKKEEALALRKDLYEANAEMEVINSEKKQIVHQWKQSLASLEKLDSVTAEIRESAKKCEEDTGTLNMDIVAYKKLMRKELERNEQLTLQKKFRESDIFRIQKNLSEVLEQENDISNNLSVMDKTIEITEQELKLLLDEVKVKEKELEVKEKRLQRLYSNEKNLQSKHMNMLHEKMTITKASKYTEKLIQDTRRSINMNEEKGSKKENEKEKLLLQLDNLKNFVLNLENTLKELNKERVERSILLDKNEANALKTQEKIDSKRNESKELDNKLKNMIVEAGGQELAPFEREIANLKKEMVIAEQGTRNMEEEYLRRQQQLFSLSKQSFIKSEENEFCLKKIAVMESKKIQLEADITKEERDIKEAENRVQSIINDIAHINNLLHERKELQETLLQTTHLSKSDFIKVLKIAELNYLQKQNQLKILRRKKKKNFQKLLESQQHIVFWEGKVHLAEETRKILKSEPYLVELYNLKSEIRRLQVKHEHIKKEQTKLVSNMQRAVYRYTSLYVEADKQSLFGKRKKTPDYVKKRIKYTQNKVQEQKKVLKNSIQELETLKTTESDLNGEINLTNIQASELTNKIKSLENEVFNKEREKRQAIIKLSLKQKKSKFLQKVLDETYVRAVRNERKRDEELGKLKDAMQTIEIITQAVMHENSDLDYDFKKILDYLFISKQI